jgi:hypothetical protein
MCMGGAMTVLCFKGVVFYFVGELINVKHHVVGWAISVVACARIVLLCLFV